MPRRAEDMAFYGAAQNTCGRTLAAATAQGFFLVLFYTVSGVLQIPWQQGRRMEMRADEWNSPAETEKPPQGLGEKKRSKGRALARVSVWPGR